MQSVPPGSRMDHFGGTYGNREERGLSVKILMKDISSDSCQNGIQFEILVFFEDGCQKETAFQERKNLYCSKLTIPRSIKSFTYTIKRKDSVKNDFFWGSYQKRKVNVPQEQPGIISLVLYDVVSSEGMRESDWINHAEKWMLELLSDEEEYHLIFTTITELYAWVQHVINGWTFQTIDGDKCMTLLDIRKFLTSALPHISKPKSPSRVRSITDTVTYLGLTFDKLKLDEESEMICEVLSLHDLDREDQDLLFQKLQEDENNHSIRIPDVCEILKKLFLQMKFSFHCKWIFLLPLFWLMKRKGEVPLKFEGPLMLESPIAELPAIDEELWEHMKTIASTDGCQKMLGDIFSKMLKIMELHQWIERPYIFLMRSVTLLELIEKYPEELKKFDAIVIIAKLLDSLTIQDSDVTHETLQKKELEPTFQNFYCKLEETDNGSKKHDVMGYTIKKAVTSLSKVEKLSWNDLIWTAQLCLGIFNCSQMLQSTFVSKACLPNLLVVVKKEIKNLKREQIVFFNPSADKCHIEYWNELLQFQWGNQQIFKQWNEEWNREILNVIEAKLLELCNGKYDKFSASAYNSLPSNILQDLKSVFEKIADLCLQKLMQLSFEGSSGKEFWSKLFKSWKKADEKSLKKSSQISFNARLVTLQNYFPNASFQEHALRFVLNWEGAEHFYKEWYPKLKLEESSVVYKITNAFFMMYEPLSSECISYNMVDILMEKSSNTAKIYNILTNNLCTELINEVVKARKEQQKKIKEVLKNSLFLFEVNRLYSSAGLDLQEQDLVKYAYSMNINNHALLKDIKAIIPLADIIERIDNDVIQDAKSILVEQKNLILLCLCINEISNWKSTSSAESTNLEWAIVKMRDLKGIGKIHHKRISEGAIPLWEVDCWIQHIDASTSKSTVEKVMDNLEQFCIPNPTCCQKGEGSSVVGYAATMNDIYSKIVIYMELSQYESAVSVLFEMKDKLGLKVEDQHYSIIEYIHTYISKKDSILNELKEDAACVIPSLSKVFKSRDERYVSTETVTKAASDINLVTLLESFLKHNDFIYWLQSTMRDASEINIMCELAANSYKGNDDDANFTKRLIDFTDAVNGFAPLIFGLQKRTFSLSTLLEKCASVKNNFKANSYLGMQWITSAQNLTFFKETEFQHGSVERHSYVQANVIVKSGIFKIHVQCDNKLFYKSTIRVIIPPPEQQHERKVFSYNELQEIQSLLSLATQTTDKANDIPKLFSSRLHIVDRLAKVLENLNRDGCMIFQSSAIIISPSQNNKLTIEIKLTADESFEENQCGLGDAENLAVLLEAMLSRWRRHVHKQRMKHYFLNEFSLEQMSYLCQQLAPSRNRNDDSTLPDQVCALLSFIGSEQSQVGDLLSRSISNTDANSVSSDTQEGGNAEGNIQDDDTVNLSKKIELEKSLCKKMRCESEVAQAAIQKEGENEMKCTKWIMRNQKKTNLVMSLSKKYQENMGFISRSQRLQAEQNIKESSITSFIKEKCISFMTENSLPNLDCLQLSQLGRFLQALKNQNKNTLLTRKINPLLKCGVPNLICLATKMYQTIISLYMESPGQPLPTSSEVLICSESTTNSTVRRFMIRAMKICENKGKPLFILAAIDNLKQSVMKFVETIYNELKNDVSKDPAYQLVFLCQNPKNYLAVCFEKYLVDGLHIKEDQAIMEYLRVCLTVDHKNHESAALIDANRSLLKIVTSASSGSGKSLYISRSRKKLEARASLPRFCTIKFLEKNLKPQQAMRKLISDSSSVQHQYPHFVHLDITTAVKNGAEEFLFNLLILGSIEGDGGRTWRRHSNHYYMVEVTDYKLVENKHSDSTLLNFLPCIITLQPHEIIKMGRQKNVVGMDRILFESEDFQRPFQYLKCNNADLNTFFYSDVEGEEEECIRIFLKNCSIPNPTWAQMHAFAKFLNTQLKTCEQSIYCGEHGIFGLRKFAMKLMIEMSCNFSFNSSSMSSQTETSTNDITCNLQISQLGWCDSNKPCIFFNEDGHTMTFINVRSHHIYEHVFGKDKLHITPRKLALLHDNLDKCGVLNVDLASKEREELLGILCIVLGVKKVFDPDPSYELTKDNVFKIIAIHMRMRCNIPVILMGETGCGKTRMLEFMKNLLEGRSDTELVFITKKIYGGITVSDIQKTVKKVIEKCRQGYGSQDTAPTKRRIGYLFFDEVNTTEAVHAIKEVICDKTCDGESIAKVDIRIIAACNPYKKLSKAATQRLQKSCLGGNVHANQNDQADRDAMNELLYKVVPLPPSMEIFVWNFGEIDIDTERRYIQQMSQRINHHDMDLEVFCHVISKAQQYMRAQNTECRFVSLRDVERCLEVYQWFRKHGAVLLKLIKDKYGQSLIQKEKKGIWEILQTVGVCYHVSLENRREFREEIISALLDVCPDMTQQDLLKEFEVVQKIFIDEANLESDISQNQSLKENFFLMAICADLKIPLFVMGKPGSSKSLAKVAISSSMRGAYSQSKLFSVLNQVRIFTLQCSALTKAEDILRISKLCSQLPNPNKNLVGVVVLEEIGLAEDSPDLPLKVLHSMLDSHSVISGEKQNIGFFGISNWPLDPAKINRGIFLFRNEPEESDLIKTAISICGEDRINIETRKLLENITKTYLQIYREQHVEFFGLRDFYSLIKTIKYASNDVSKIWNAITRNFSGSSYEVLSAYLKALQKSFPSLNHLAVPLKAIVEDNLGESDSRFLLLLTNYHASVDLLFILLKDVEKGERKYQVVFGSSFPGDKNFTEYCRSVRHIKYCMETGKTVILLNLSEIHESLYDALNQHYVQLGGKRYVDIGLKGHSFKTCISPKFRLIVLENREKVKNYPIPLINRLEKHILDASGLLQDCHRCLDEELRTWMDKFVPKEFRHTDTFIGYQKDTASCSLLCHNGNIEEAKNAVLQTITMDAIYRLDNIIYKKKYLDSQFHSNLLDLLKYVFQNQTGIKTQTFEIVTFSDILPSLSKKTYEKALGLSKDSVMILDLKTYDMRRQFEEDLDCFLHRCKRPISEEEEHFREGAILIIQCSQAEKNGDLMECAKYLWNEKDKKNIQIPIVVIILWSVERNHGTKSILVQMSPEYKLIYMDEVTFDSSKIPAAQLMQTNFHEIFKKLDKNAKYTKHLLKNCLRKALVKIQGSRNSQQRYFIRLECLTKLFDGENDLSRTFRGNMIDKLGNALSNSGSEFEDSTWMLEEARKKESLQECGTFYKALLMRCKSILSNLLAHFICIVDVYSNLNHIYTDTEWKVDLWFKIMEILPLDLPSGFSSNEFIAVTTSHPRPSMICDIPFCFFITKFFEEAWKNVRNSANAEQELVLQFEKFWAYDILVNAFHCEDITNGYIHDLLESFYIPGNELHREKECSAAIKIVKKATSKSLNNFYDSKKVINTVASVSHSLPLAYIAFKTIEDNLRKLSQVFAACPKILEYVDIWLRNFDITDYGSNIPIMALECAVSVLIDEVKAMPENDPDKCLSWIQNSTSIQQTLYSLKTALQNEQQVVKLMKHWNPVYLLNLLLLLLIPNNAFQKYSPIMVWAAKLLCEASEDEVSEFTESICGMLRKCYETVEIRIKVQWGSEFCLCSEQFSKPWHLKCGHFCCNSCYETKILSKKNKKCPTCDNQLKISDITPAQVPNCDKDNLNQFKSNCTSFFKEFLKNIFSEKTTGNKDLLLNLLFILIFEKDGKTQIESDGSSLDSMALNLDINTKSIVLAYLLKSKSMSNEIQAKIHEDIDRYLLEFQGDNLIDLTRIVLYHFEKKAKCKTAGKKTSTFWKKYLKKLWNEVSQSNQTVLNVEFLKTFAKVRNVIRILVFKIYQSDEADLYCDLVEFIQKTGEIFSEYRMRNLDYFFVKVGCYKYGISWLKQISEVNVTKGLIPMSIADQLDDLCPYSDLLWNAMMKINQPTKGTFQHDLCRTTALTDQNQAEFAKLDEDLHAFLKEEYVVKKHYLCMIHFLTLSVQALIYQDCYLMEIFESLANNRSHISKVFAVALFQEFHDVISHEKICFLQFLVFASLLIGFLKNPSNIQKILSDPITKEDVGVYLIKNLVKILMRMNDRLCVKDDDLCLFFFTALQKISNEGKGRSSGMIPDLSTTDKQKIWIQTFDSQYMCKSTEDEKDFVTIVTNAGTKMLILRLYQIIKEDSDFVSEPQDKRVNRVLLEYTERSSLSQVRYNLNHFQNANTLKYILDTEHIEVLGSLDSILTLQSLFVMRCQNNRSYEECENIFVSDLLQDEKDKELTLTYITIYNKVLTSIKKYVSDMEDLHNSPDDFSCISLQSHVAYFLPSNHGIGQCAKIFAEYLLNMHNRLLDTYEGSRKDSSSRKLDVSQFMHIHAVNITIEDDIVPLIQTHAEYDITDEIMGRQHCIKYNLEAVDKLIQENFLKHKRKIDIKTLPLMWYTQQKGIESDWNAICRKFPQTSLSSNTTQAVDNISSFSTILYQGVRSLTIAISFLGSHLTDQVELTLDTPIVKFLHKKLEMANSELTAVPSTAKIKHILALYSRLSWYRSVLFISRGLDPYKEILQNGSQEDIGEDKLKKDVKDAFEILNMNTFQQQINQLIMRFSHAPPGKSITAEIMPFVTLRFTEGSEHNFQDKLPKEILFKHISWLMKMAVKYNDNTKVI